MHGATKIYNIEKVVAWPQKYYENGTKTQGPINTESLRVTNDLKSEWSNALSYLKGWFTHAVNVAVFVNGIVDLFDVDV